MEWNDKSSMALQEVRTIHCLGAYCKSITKIQMSSWLSFICFFNYKYNILWTVCYAKQMHMFSSILKSYF